MSVARTVVDDRPDTAVTAAEMTAHADRHSYLAATTGDHRYAAAHLSAAAGLYETAAAHRALDALDTERGYR